MPKPSDDLKAKGWKPKRDDCPPRDTLWLCPSDKEYYDFISAVVKQAEIDRKKEPQP